jgi:hypothetical protein
LGLPITCSSWAPFGVDGASHPEVLPTDLAKTSVESAAARSVGTGSQRYANDGMRPSEPWDGRPGPNASFRSLGSPANYAYRIKVPAIERGRRVTNLLGVLVYPLPVVRIPGDAGKLDRVIIEKHAIEDEWTEDGVGGVRTRRTAPTPSIASRWPSKLREKAVEAALQGPSVNRANDGRPSALPPTGNIALASSTNRPERRT